MKIIEIKSTSKKSILSFDNGTSLSIVNDALSEFYLYKNKELSEVDLNKLREFSLFSTHYQYALKLLARANYSTSEIRKKLEARSVTSALIDLIIKRLTLNNLLNDKNYAQNVFNYYLKELYGPRFIVQKLEEKGIDEAIIKEVVQFDEASLQENARLLADKLVNSKQIVAKSKLLNKIYSKLTRYGYAHDIIYEIIDAYRNTLEIDETELIKKDLRKISEKPAQKKLKPLEKKTTILQKLKQKGYSYSQIKNVLEDEENVY